ncbi:unnamed protein product [Cochlearia groenlandica]
MKKKKEEEEEEEEKMMKSSLQSKYRGVRKRKWGKWVSEIRLPNSRERIWLGSYDTPVKAARAFDAAQFCLRGGDADFNFPDNPPDIDGGKSLSPPEIREAAARFANFEDGSGLSGSEFRPDSPFSSSSSSVSEVVTTSETTTVGCDWSFLDRIPMDFGMFDEFSGDGFSEILTVEDYYGEENFDGSLFLWDF